MNDETNILLAWSFSTDKNRSKLWYVLALSVALGFIVWAFLSMQYIFGFLVILIVGVYFFVENNSDDKVDVVITNLGINVNSEFISFSKIKSYFIVYSGNQAMMIRLNLLGRGIKVIDLNIDNNIVEPLIGVISQIAEQDEHGELSLTDKIIKLLKL